MPEKNDNTSRDRYLEELGLLHEHIKNAQYFKYPNRAPMLMAIASEELFCLSNETDPANLSENKVKEVFQFLEVLEQTNPKTLGLALMLLSYILYEGLGQKGLLRD